MKVLNSYTHRMEEMPEERKNNGTYKSDRGELFVGGTRMCILDIPGGWFNIDSSISLLAGKETTKRVFFEAGCSETFSATALKKGVLNHTEEGFKRAVDIYSKAGFGWFVIEELRFEKGWTRITCENTFEGWAYLQKRGSSRECMHSFW